MFGVKLEEIRKSLAGLFGLSALMCAWKFVSLAIWLNEDGYNFLQLRSVYLMYFPALAAINAIAWWTVWRDKRWARIWGIVASLICIGLPLRKILRFDLSPWDDLGGLVFLGVVCLIAFLWPSATKAVTEDSEPEEKAA